METKAHTARPPAPPRTGSHVVAIVLLSLALIVLVAGLSVWFGMKFLARNVQVSVDDSEGRKEVSIRTPLGSLEVKPQVDEARIGLPVYPHARRVEEEGSASIHVGLPDAKSLRVYAARFETDDPLEKVRDFYAEQLRGRLTKSAEKTPDGKVVFEIKRDGQEQLVVLESKRGRTQIGLVRILHSEDGTN
jgi:hypothetical protein